MFVSITLCPYIHIFRSHSSSAHSVISTYAGSTPSCDILYQQHTINHHNFIVRSRSDDDDDDSHSEIGNQNVNNNSSCSSSCSGTSGTSSISIGLDKVHEIISDKIEDNIDDDAGDEVNRFSQTYISSREDKENINTVVTLITDDSDSSGVIGIAPAADESGVEEDETIAKATNTKMPPTNNTNAKLPGRQTNNSLSSLTGNIFIPPFNNSGASGNAGSSGTKEDPPPAAPARKKKVKSSEV